MKDYISELKELSDEELMKKIGLDKKLSQCRAGLDKLDKLSDKDRTKANERIEKMFTPNVWLEEFNYIAEDIAREKEHKKCCAAQLQEIGNEEPYDDEESD